MRFEALGPLQLHDSDGVLELTSTCQHALDLNMSRANSRRVGTYFTELSGYAHQRLGDDRQAIVCLQAAIDVYLDIGETKRLALSRIRIARSLDQIGHTHAARNELNHAIAEADAYGLQREARQAARELETLRSC